MIDYLAAQLGLGLAGIDPIGALLVAGALAAGASPRAVLAFAGTCLLLTLGLGAAFAYALGPLLARVADALQLADHWWLVLELVVAAALLAWGVRRLRRGSGQPSSATSARSGRGIGVAAMTLSGALWGVAAATDPTFYASALLAGSRDAPLMLAGIALWYAVSQLPLHALTGAVLAGRHQRATQRLRAIMTRWSVPLRRTATVLVFAGAALLVADTATYLVTDAFLIG